jgi:hypothetical protein
MIETQVTITRKGATIAKDVDVQIDTKNPMMAAYYNNAHPYDVFDLYVKYAPPTWTLLRGDEATDQKNIDPLTKALTLYRVVGRPQPFDDGHIEAVVNLFTGPN